MEESPIFEDVRFFLQRDLIEKDREKLINKIESNGGGVIDKVPIKGFLLTAPGSQEEDRLKHLYISEKKPERFLVPYTFVDVCLKSGKLIDPIFQHNGTPLGFNIQINHEKQRKKAAELILCGGGDPYCLDDDADIIIADPESQKALAKQYQDEAGTSVETILWIQGCINDNEYKQPERFIKRLGGRKAGAVRNEYLDHEDTLLAEYLARCLPNKASGGRTGNKVYKELLDQANVGRADTAWALRHSWQSWRNRYTQHTRRFDKMIQDYVKRHKIEDPAYGQHTIIRRKGVTRSSMQDPDRSSELESGDENVVRKRKRLDPPPSQSNGNSVAGPSRVVLQDGDGDRSQSLERHNLEFEGSQETQFPVKEGNRSPPGWSKPSGAGEIRKTSQNYENNNAEERKRSISIELMDFGKQSSEHGDDGDAEDEILKIAERFVWRVEEVREEYERLGGDLKATKRQIRSFRSMIDKHKSSSS